MQIILIYYFYIFSFYTGFLLFGGKFDNFLLILPVKRVRIWVFRQFPHPDPTLERDIRYDDDDD